jgi:glycosyltransferase involved in cell wall biosynthesis
VLADELERDGVEHLHAHFGTNSAAVAMLCRQLGGPPYSFTVHGPDEFDKAPLLGLGQKTTNAAFVVAISSFGRSQLCRLNKLSDWDKIHVVRCGLDEVLLEREPTPVPEARRVVCVARLSEQKGHLMLLDAAARLVREGQSFELVLAGDGELRALVDQRIRELGLEQTVRITGWISERQVAEEIEASRALVLPSLAEGLPVVLMEALALGRPVLSTYIAGIPELVVPGENGWLVPAGDVAAVTSALREILNAPSARLTEMGRAGRSAVLERHDVRKTSALLRGLIESGGKTASSRPAGAASVQR